MIRDSYSSSSANVISRGGGNHYLNDNDAIVSSQSSCFVPHWNLYPKTYVAPKISPSSSSSLLDQLDGDLTKDVWRDVPFSDLFDDIRGPNDAPEDDRPSIFCSTKFKAIWDDAHLYIGALLESNFETRAEFMERNSPIYQKDSDFEVFVDPIGTNHRYKELEVNAINTVWNLMLDKPYDDGGVEHSGRIARPGDKLYYEVYHQKTATKLLRGTLNDPHGSATWSIEVALSYKDLMAGVDVSTDKDQGDDDNFSYKPTIGSMMRINFSRVERQGAINWTWQPQIVWDPTHKRYSGYVAMHLPDAWGYMVLGGEKSAIISSSNNKSENIKKTDDQPTPSIIPRDPTWPGRLAAMNIYYAQRVYYSQQQRERYASSTEQLRDLVDPKIVGPFQIQIELVVKNDDGKGGGYVATVTGNPDGSVVTVTQDRLLKVVHPNTSSVLSLLES